MIRALTPLPFLTLYLWVKSLLIGLMYECLDSLLMMSLGAGALKVSGGGGGSNATIREEVSMATLEAGTTPRAATNQHYHTE